MVPLWVVLCAISGGALLLRSSEACRIGAVLLCNWGLNTLIVEASGQPDPWAAFGAVDWLTVWIIARPYMGGTSRAGATVVMLLAMQLVIHSAYGFSGKDDLAEYYYWWALHYTAWGQAWALLIVEAVSGGHRASSGADAPDRRVDGCDMGGGVPVRSERLK